MKDLLQEIWSNLRRNKLRTCLTGFAVAWGIFMLILLLGAGNGLIHGIEGNSGNYMANSINAWGRTTTLPWDGLKEGRRISLKDQDAIRTKEPPFDAHVDEVATAIRQSGLTAVYGSEYTNSFLMGVEPGFAAMEKLELMYGRFLSDLDMREQRKVVVMGSNEARELLGASDEREAGLSVREKARKARKLIGKFVNINGIPFQVVGIIRPDERGGGSRMYIPMSTLRTLYRRGDTVDELYFSFHGLKTKEANEAFEQAYRKKLNLAHRAAPNDNNAIGIWNRFTMNMEMEGAMGIIRTALWIIGILTLLSGIVGVSNIMLISVKERTHELGIRKAIGATPGSLLRLILTESVLVTGFFGYVGMFLGVVATEYLDKISQNMVMDVGLFQMTVFKDPTVGLGVCLGATLLLVIAGTLAGLAPARRAAHVRPIEALRAE